MQSVPPQGKLPQVFETSDELVAHAEWNALLPRQLRPADMAVIDVPGSDGVARKALVLLGPTGSFPPETVGLHQNLTSASLFRLDPGQAANLPVDATFDAIEVGRVYFTDATTGVAAGDLLLFVAKLGTSLVKLILRAEAVTVEPALKRVRVDVEPLPDPAAPPPPPPVFTVPYAIKPIFTFARPLISTVTFTGSNITSTVVNRAWREADLQAMIGIQRWSATSLVKAITHPARATRRSRPRPAPSRSARSSASSATTGRSGRSCRTARTPTAPPTATAGTSVIRSAPSARSRARRSAPRARSGPIRRATRSPPAPSSNAPCPASAAAAGRYLMHPKPGRRPTPCLTRAKPSRADYGLSGRAMAITLASDSGAVLPTPTIGFPFRSTTAYVASRQLPLADLPIDSPVGPGETPIELDRMVLGLTVGRPIALTGERADLPGVEAAEIAILKDIVHADSRTTLTLERPLVYSYVRSTLKISANVVHATHGETINEVLGNGDASQPNQSFVLKKPPTTYLSAPTASGVASTLEVRINGVRWDEVPSLYGEGPNDPVYTTRIANDAKMTLTFGDGVQGARLPTGSVNVAARYRSGIGPDGEVAAATLTMLRAMPLGLRGVTNAVPASGAEGPGAAGRRAPQRAVDLLTFERVVSLLDYENYARAYPGIGKARGDVLWINGASMVFLTRGRRDRRRAGRRRADEPRPVDRRRERPIAALRGRGVRAALFQPRRRYRDRSALRLRGRAGCGAQPAARVVRLRCARPGSVGDGRRSHGADPHGAGRDRGRPDRTAALCRRRSRPPTLRSTRCPPSVRAVRRRGDGQDPRPSCC